MKKLLLPPLFILLVISASAQQWGLYTLYAPKNGTQAFLIDTADSPTTYKTWTFNSSKKNGYSTYLVVPGDTIVRTYSYSGNTFSGGGITGGVQKVAWDGTVIWDYVHSSSTYCIHHDICPMPNGHVLMISYESKTSAEVTAAGCTSSLSSGMWSEKIIEVKPTGATTGEIVWEWHLWDHICQNSSSSKPNYVSSVSANPQLMNINYNTQKDWWHMNGIDYNAQLDQIVVSSHNMNEVYVIDHSTTTAEAASHSGGNSGKGGDFLYRWGNPAAYGASGTANFNVIHDAHWVPSNNPNYPSYLAAYNNKGGTGSKTAIDVWNPPYNGNSYTMNTATAQSPTSYSYRYTSTFAASNEGNSQQLPNGNMLVNNPFGAVYEINSTGSVLWSRNTSSTHCYRFSLCQVRGPIATATASAYSVCNGSPVTLNASAISVTESSPNYTYSWSDGSSGASINVSPGVATTYTVTVTNTAIGCSDTASVHISIGGSAVVPTISESNDQLISSQAISYQWYLNGNIINGATSQSYTPTANGSYTVSTVDASGCSATSASYIFTITGVEIVSSTTVTLYPNPTEGIIYFNGFNFDDQYTICIRDITGKILITESLTNEINISEFENGVYFIRIGNNKDFSDRIVILRK